MAASDKINDAAQDAQSEIKALKEQVQSLMSDRVTPAIANVAGQAETYVKQARDMATDQTEQLSEKVRESPLIAILIASGVGYLLGRIAR